jgi:DNA-binding transcriptional LysR family regulator
MSEPLLARRGLSFERLETFCRVAESGSIVKAARRDPVRQSLFSRQIKELEGFFGLELIQRDGRGIRLTSAGKRLAQLAREQFAALRGFQEEARQAPVTLTLGAGNSVLEWIITPLLPRLCHQLPGVQLSLLNQRSRDIVRDLQDFKLDIGIVREDAMAKGLKQAPFRKLSYALIAGHKLGRGLHDDQVLKRLDQFPMALAESESFQPKFLAAAAKAGLTSRVTVFCSSFTQVAELVASGGFAGVLPTVASDALSSRGCRVVSAPFLDACSRRLCLAWQPRLAMVRPVIEKAVAALRAAEG